MATVYIVAVLVVVYMLSSYPYGVHVTFTNIVFSPCHSMAYMMALT